MIQRKDILAFNFYKKEKFTGSYKGMRYRIEKSEQEKETYFLATIWPGPYSYAATDSALKTEKTFPFKEESLNEITEYLNASYEAKKDDWPTGIS
ncbi:MAG: GNAT family acetyltransferase [Lachnospiraceae bacterium]|nr:GNAT family acetyltransferase [Lachnospiraceae bacterium]